MSAEALSSAANRAWIEALPVPAVLTSDGWDHGGATLQAANGAFCALTGYAPAELAGRNLRLLHGARTDVRSLQRTHHRGNPAASGSGEGWLYRRDGSAFYARWNYGPQVAGSGGPMIVVFRDETEKWQQHEALLHAQKLGTVGLLAGGVAHDFNNLLSVINGYCEILARKLERASSAVRKDLAEIHRAGLKAAATARQLLEFSRRRDIESGVINYNTLIREIAAIIRRGCGEAVEVELRLASDLNNARFNAIHFQQVLLNLCFNARDAMPGGGQLVLRTFNHTVTETGDTGLPAGNYAALAVNDTGTGIAPAALARIFEPFYTTKTQGTGLGLSTARALLDQAGGFLRATSRLGEGTTFELFLPATVEPEDRGITELPSLPRTRGSEVVWVIERDEALRKMIAGILTSDGYAVSQAADLDEAASLAGQPQLVIADTSPKRAAAGIARWFAHNPAMRVIGTAREALGLPPGTEARPEQIVHLPKPFALSTLVTRVRDLLDRGAERVE